MDTKDIYPKIRWIKYNLLNVVCAVQATQRFQLVFRVSSSPCSYQRWARAVRARCRLFCYRWRQLKPFCRQYWARSHWDWQRSTALTSQVCRCSQRRETHSNWIHRLSTSFWNLWGITNPSLTFVSLPVKPQAMNVNISRSCPSHAAVIIGVMLQSQNMRLELQLRVVKNNFKPRTLFPSPRVC